MDPAEHAGHGGVRVWGWPFLEGGLAETRAPAQAKMLQNLGWATGYNLVAVPVAAGALDPEVGAVLMSTSTIVALNAQLLRGLDLR